MINSIVSTENTVHEIKKPVTFTQKNNTQKSSKSECKPDIGGGPLTCQEQKSCASYQREDSEFKTFKGLANMPILIPFRGYILKP